MAQRALTFHAQDGTALPFLLHLPAAHAAHPRRRWPLVLHLHGAGERGHDLRALLRNDLPRRLEHAPRFPFVVASPQCPPRTTWSPLLPTLLELVDDMIRIARANPRRVHVTGSSMGGSGTWQLAALAPHRFASAVPICASIPPLHGWPALAARAASVPVWAFHGSRDPVISATNARVLQAVHKGAGGRSRLSVLRGVGHEAWSHAYGDPRLWAWMSHRISA